jgi:SPP1 family phage portal protein
VIFFLAFPPIARYSQIRIGRQNDRERRAEMAEDTTACKDTGALDVDTALVLGVWNDGETMRTKQAGYLQYYDGKQKILSETKPRTDGAAKHLVVTNWIRHVVERHVGFLSAKSIGLTQRNDLDDKAPLRQYQEVSDFNGVDAIDAEHLRNSLLFGLSPEVHSYDGENIVLTPYSPLEWSFMRDSCDEVVFAVHRLVLPKGSYYDGKRQATEVTLWTAYDSVNVYRYQSTGSALGSGTTPSSVSFDESKAKVQKHGFKTVPIVIFQIHQDRRPFISDALIGQQDVFNSVRSANADDVSYNVDSFLAIYGYSMEQMLEVDPETKKNQLEKIREERYLPLGENARAEFLKKGNEHQNVEFDLDLSVDAIHMMGGISNLKRIVGSTGNTSGISLKLCFTDQVHVAGTFGKWFEVGIRDRVDLLNERWAQLGDSTLEDYDVRITTDVPVNEAEFFQNIPELLQVMSRRGVARLAPAIEDVDRVVNEKDEELARDIEAGIRPQYLGVSRETSQADLASGGGADGD